MTSVDQTTRIHSGLVIGARAISTRRRGPLSGGLISGAVALALLSGCGSSRETEAEVADEPTSTLTREVLNQVQLDDYELSIERVSTGEGEDSLLLVETLQSNDLLTALTNEYGPLTSLEVFLALAPEGSEPHPDVLAAHEGEARALGRSGDVLAVQVHDGRDLAVEKSVAVECNRQLPNSFFDVQPFVPSDFTVTNIDIDGVLLFTCLGNVRGTGTPTGCTRYHPSKLLRMSACNDTVSVDPITVTMFLDGLASRFPDVVAPGTGKRYTVSPVPPPLPNPIRNRTMAVRSQNNPAHAVNASIHVGVVGTL